MTFLPECGAEAFLLIKWVHNDFMYVRIAGMRKQGASLHTRICPRYILHV